MNTLKYYKMNENVKSPLPATKGSACFDICANIKPDDLIVVYDMHNNKIERKPELHGEIYNQELAIFIKPADRILIPTGLIFDIPVNHSVRLHPRSSISLKKGLTIPNGEGIIDSDYYHQTFVMLYNAGADTINILNGERIAQAELIKTYEYDIKETKNIPEQTTNRVGGFGSTGVK